MSDGLIASEIVILRFLGQVSAVRTGPLIAGAPPSKAVGRILLAPDMLRHMIPLNPRLLVLQPL